MLEECFCMFLPSDIQTQWRFYLCWGKMTLCFHLDKSLKLRICNFFIVRIAFLVFFILFVIKRGISPFFCTFLLIKRGKKVLLPNLFAAFRQEGVAEVAFCCNICLRGADYLFFNHFAKNFVILNIFTWLYLIVIFIRS